MSNIPKNLSNEQILQPSSVTKSSLGILAFAIQYSQKINLLKVRNLHFQ